MAKTIFQLVGEYANVLTRGVDSEETRAFRATHAGNAVLLEYADALDRIKRRLSGKGVTPAVAAAVEPLEDGEGYLKCPNVDCGYADVPSGFAHYVPPNDPPDRPFSGAVECRQCGTVAHQQEFIDAYKGQTQPPR